MRQLISISVIFLFTLDIAGQTQTDSLVHAFHTQKNDSLRIDAATRLFSPLVNQYPDSLYLIIQEANVLAEKNAYHERSVKLLTLQGQVFERLNDYLQAQKAYILAEKLLDSIKSTIPDTTFIKHKLSLNNNMAIIYFRTEKMEDAKNSYREMIRFIDGSEDSILFSGMKDFYMMANQNLGSVYLQVFDYDQAEIYYLKAMSSLNPDDKKGMASIMNNLGIIEKDRGHFERSLDYLSRALQIRRETGSLEGTIQSLNNLGNLFMMMGMLNQALDTLIKSRQMAKENKFLRSETIAVELLSGLYYEQRDYKNAYLTYQEYKQQYDSLMNQENIQNITQLQMQQRFEERMHEDNLVRQQDDLKRQKKEAVYLFTMIIALLLFAVLIMLYALQRSKLKRHKLIADKDRLTAKSLELENEKLNLELDYKNKELTTNVIYLARTNEFISGLAEKLMKSRLSFKKENQQLIDELVRELNTFSDRDTWKEFELRFQEVHTEFYNKLLLQFPDLSANEKKLCAFLRLNMTSKEISAITYQSVNSIIVARSRLRKKLGIDQDENLIAYLERL